MNVSQLLLKTFESSNAMDSRIVHFWDGSVKKGNFLSFFAHFWGWGGVFLVQIKTYGLWGLAQAFVGTGL